jgi:hypothetical protein
MDGNSKGSCMTKATDTTVPNSKKLNQKVKFLKPIIHKAV